jgi:putative effector of murein hydrolase LrgA (UPF0299 family)
MSKRTPSDKQMSMLAGALLVAGCLIGGLIIASGVLADLPGADTLMAIALLLLVPATLGLIAFLWMLNKQATQ